MSAISAPLCPICNTAHWCREPHQFAKPKREQIIATYTPPAKPKKKAKKKGKKK